MCLGVPGRIIEIAGSEDSGGSRRLRDDPLTRMAKVSFGGTIADVCLAVVPEAAVGEYVIVHAGFALSVLDEQEAGQVFKYLEEIAAAESALAKENPLRGGARVAPPAVQPPR